ncbi:hypothetical protein ANN_22091 [Periplaneta americana]|uniref:Uncharacterized protein n=1 Tax=Periplaneta americana TaxID=6978 RepID=A0ABQ8S7J7_PERAM|nr:hypothetical protein ANN_22091 [Periplaneta americana]
MDSFRTQTGHDDQVRKSGGVCGLTGLEIHLTSILCSVYGAGYSVFRAPRPRNHVELVTCVQREWNSVNQKDTVKLIESCV